MSFTKINEVLVVPQSNYSPEAREKWDNLAKLVFNPEPSYSSDRFVYISPEMSFTPQVIAAYGLEAKDVSNVVAGIEMPKHFGNYEKILFGKIFKHVRNVTILSGGVGSGKSTTLRQLETEFLRLGDYNPLIGKIDFDVSTLINETDEQIVKKEFQEQICNRLQAVATNTVISKEEEFGIFWNLELNELSNTNYRSSVFSFIQGKLNLLDEDELADEKVLREKQKEIRNTIEQDLSKRLEYLLRLWHYLVNRESNDIDKSSVLMIDNLDQLKPIAAFTVLRIIQSASRHDSILWLVALRPETYNQFQLGANIIDYIPHYGPRPWRIVKYSLDNFLNDPSSFYKDTVNLSESKYKELVAFLNRVRDVINTDKKKVVERFFDAACGSNIRKALTIAQTFIHMKFAMVNPQDISEHTIVRELIRMGKPTFEPNSSYPIENLFHVESVRSETYLVKARILKYLSNYDSAESKLSELLAEMTKFGYAMETVRLALNDMLEPLRQLLRTNKVDFYDSVINLLDSSDHVIKMTKSGKGYISTLFYDMHYIQEVMLDCKIDTDKFGVSRQYDFLKDKFEILLEFLNIVYKQDIHETEIYLAENRDAEYKNAFGEYLLGWEIVNSIREPLNNIIASLRNRDRFGVIKGTLDSLHTEYYNQNFRLLNKYPDRAN